MAKVEEVGVARLARLDRASARVVDAFCDLPPEERSALLVRAVRECDRQCADWMAVQESAASIGMNVSGRLATERGYEVFLSSAAVMGVMLMLERAREREGEGEDGIDAVRARALKNQQPRRGWVGVMTSWVRWWR